MTYRFSSLTIKKKQVILRTGFLVRQTVDISVARIESIDIRQTVFGSLFHYGSLVITGTGGTRQLINYLSSMNVSYKIFVHTEEKNLQLNFEHVLVTDPNPIRSFVNLSNSDIVVGSRSAHSSVPSIVSGSLALVPARNWLPCPSHWIKVTDSGSFDLTLLEKYVAKSSAK